MYVGTLYLYLFVYADFCDFKAAFLSPPRYLYTYTVDS